MTAKLWAVPLGMLCMILLPCDRAIAQVPDEPQVTQLETEVRSLRDQVDGLARELRSVQSDLEERADIGLLLLLYGAFCALWAQNTGRSAWSWFFLGLFFNVIAAVVLLSKNAGDRARMAEL